MSDKNVKWIPLIKESRTNEKTIVRYPVKWVRKIPQFKDEKIKVNFFENLGIILLNNQNEIIEKFLNSMNSLEHAKKLKLEDIELLFEYLEQNPKFSLNVMLSNLIQIFEEGKKLGQLNEPSITTRKVALIQRLQNLQLLKHMDHRILDDINNRIIFEPYDISSEEIKKISEVLEFRWEITAKSPYFPLKSILVTGVPQNEDDNIFTRSKKEEARIESMEPVKLSELDKLSFEKRITESVEKENEKFKAFQTIVKKFCEENNYNLEWNKIQPRITNFDGDQTKHFKKEFEKIIGENHMWRYLYGEMEGFTLKRYIDGWTLESTIINVNEKIEPEQICITPVVDIRKVLEIFQNTIKYLSDIPKSKLYWENTPPPMFDDRIEKERDKIGIIKCPACKTDLTAKIYKDPKIISEYQCDCGGIINLKLKFGTYREREE